MLSPHPVSRAHRTPKSRSLSLIRATERTGGEFLGDQVTWTPNRCEIERRKNFITVEAAAARTSSVDQAGVYMSATKTDVSKLDPASKLFLRIENQCQQICDHIRSVSKNGYAVTHLTCYFKIVDGNRLFFLWARGPPPVQTRPTRRPRRRLRLRRPPQAALAARGA